MLQVFSNAWLHLSSKAGDLPIPPIDVEQTFCMVADLDNDGIDEIIIGGRNQSPALVYLKPGKPEWTTAVIDDSDVRIEAGGAFYDIDGDGYLDIVAGGDWMSNQLYWWKNPGANTSEHWQRYLIKSGGKNQYHDQIFGDFDGDGKSELVFWNQGERTLYLSKIPEDPTEGVWPYKAIYIDPDLDKFPYEGLAKGDIDGDGVEELFAGGLWFKHNGDHEFTPYVIDPNIRDPRIKLGDFNSDGKLEVIMIPADHKGRLKYYECAGDPKVVKHWNSRDLLGFDVDHGHSLQIADFNGNGHLDILCAEMRQWRDPSDNPNAKIWLLHGDGNGNFEPELIARGFCVHEAMIGDFEGKGKLGFCTKPYVWESNRIDVWLNRIK